jgi:hypothetical protein
MTTPLPTKEQAEQQLTSALRLVLLSYRDDLKFDDFHILGKCNLILQGFIDQDGDFSEEYRALAQQALKQRDTKEFQETLILDTKPEQVSLILPKGIGG